MPRASWEQLAAAGIELGYAAITSNGTSVTNYPTRTDITGLSITVTVGTRPIKIIFNCAQILNTSTGQALVSIMEGATELALGSEGAAAQIGGPCQVEARLAPSPGVHTYKIALARGSAAGTATIQAGATFPAFIQAIEC